MSNFYQSFKFLLTHEGGFTNNPNDSGGPTNMGITQRDLSDYLKRLATVDDVRNLDQETAAKIYKKYYWDALELDQVQDDKLATVIFDLAVLRGIRSVAKDLQDILDIKPDGVIGPNTLNAIDFCLPIATSIKLIQSSQLYFISICTFNRNQLTFLTGWINRTHSLINYVLDIK